MLLLSSPEYQASAQCWAERLQLPLSDLPPQDGYYLLYDAQGLALAKADEPRVKPVRIDFLGGATAHRRLYGGGRGQALAKACGLKPGISPRILDATAGLLGDSFVLASLGCEVLAVERHPWVFALGQDALDRAAASDELAEVTARLKLAQGEATRDMPALAADFRPEVVYLDPMFPHQEKSAQVKKEMQFFRELVGKDEDADALLEVALKLASHRVVVKRPRKAPCLAGSEPSLTLAGKANRFDIYTLKSLSRSG
ncbi:class I SAM-dependent methyltransferase [Marinospirillum perlucidum]|uniref:class I SAM-dependent methyltransferase n=1 Tax=Marinospirillum perlucidum TaxID=1982602 RepID=UPI000DF3F61D|nr:class I SAM-dependent methyltransferase [Marinospirillum perlucidum]